MILLSRSFLFPFVFLLIIHQFIQLEVSEDIKLCGRQHPVIGLLSSFHIVFTDLKVYILLKQKTFFEKKVSIVFPLSVGFREKKLEFWNNLKLRMINRVF